MTNGFDSTKDRLGPDGFHNQYEPTWFNQLFHARQLLQEKGWQEVRRHANVSRDNRHRCRECFCCACAEVLREHALQRPMWKR